VWLCRGGRKRGCGILEWVGLRKGEVCFRMRGSEENCICSKLTMEGRRGVVLGRLGREKGVVFERLGRVIVFGAWKGEGCGGVGVECNMQHKK